MKPLGAHNRERALAIARRHHAKTRTGLRCSALRLASARRIGRGWLRLRTRRGHLAFCLLGLPIGGRRFPRVDRRTVVVRDRVSYVSRPSNADSSATPSRFPARPTESTSCEPGTSRPRLLLRSLVSTRLSVQRDSTSHPTSAPGPRVAPGSAPDAKGATAESTVERRLLTHLVPITRTTTPPSETPPLDRTPAKDRPGRESVERRTHTSTSHRQVERSRQHTQTSDRTTDRRRVQVDDTSRSLPPRVRPVAPSHGVTAAEVRTAFAARAFRDHSMRHLVMWSTRVGSRFVPSRTGGSTPPPPRLAAPLPEASTASQPRNATTPPRHGDAVVEPTSYGAESRELADGRDVVLSRVATHSTTRGGLRLRRTQLQLHTSTQPLTASARRSESIQRAGAPADRTTSAESTVRDVTHRGSDVTASARPDFFSSGADRALPPSTVFARFAAHVTRTTHAPIAHTHARLAAARSRRAVGRVHRTQSISTHRRIETHVRRVAESIHKTHEHSRSASHALPLRSQHTVSLWDDSTSVAPKTGGSSRTDTGALAPLRLETRTATSRSGRSSVRTAIFERAAVGRFSTPRHETEVGAISASRPGSRVDRRTHSSSETRSSLILVDAQRSAPASEQGRADHHPAPAVDAPRSSEREVARSDAVRVTREIDERTEQQLVDRVYDKLVSDLRNERDRLGVPR